MDKTVQDTQRTAGLRSTLFALLSVLLILALLVPLFLPEADRTRGWFTLNRPLWLAVLAVLLVFGVAQLVQGKRDVLLLFQSEGDGKLSVSKLQLYLWLSVSAFALVYCVGVNYQIWDSGSKTWNAKTVIPGLPVFPWELMTLLGFSVGTFGIAKGIAVGTRTPQSESDSAATKTSGLVTADASDTTDMTKVQLLSWTIIACAIYVVDTLAAIRLTRSQSSLITSLPAVSSAILVLTGVSQATYLGNKLIVPRGPTLLSLGGDHAKPKDIVHVFGLNFGTTGSLTLDGVVWPTDSWKDGDVAFTVPINRPGTTTPYAKDDVIQVGIVAGGTPSVNKLPLTIVS